MNAALLLFLGFVAGLFVAMHYPARLSWAVGGWLALLVLLAIWIVWWPRREYRGWDYRLDEQVLEIRQGIWFRTMTLLPLSRLQHVDLDQGPMERSFGLATLTFYTAGSHHESIRLPGLEQARAVWLRDLLVGAGGDDAV